MSGLPAPFFLLSPHPALSGFYFWTLDNEVLLCDLIVFYLSATGCALPDSNSVKLSSCGQWRPWWEQQSVFLLVRILFQVVCFWLICASLQVNQSLILQRKEGPDKQWLLRCCQVSSCYRVHWKIHHMENTPRSAGLALCSSCVQWTFLAVAAVKFISKCIVWVSELWVLGKIEKGGAEIPELVKERWLDPSDCICASSACML